MDTADTRMMECNNLCGGLNNCTKTGNEWEALASREAIAQYISSLIHDSNATTGYDILPVTQRAPLRPSIDWYDFLEQHSKWLVLLCAFHKEMHTGYIRLHTQMFVYSSTVMIISPWTTMSMPEYPKVINAVSSHCGLIASWRASAE